MKKVDTDTLELLAKVDVEDASQSVWGIFDAALKELPEKSRELLNEHFSGTGSRQMAQKLGIPEAEAKACVELAKSELIRRIRTNCRVRQ